MHPQKVRLPLVRLLPAPAAGAGVVARGQRAHLPLVPTQQSPTTPTPRALVALRWSLPPLVPLFVAHPRPHPTPTVFRRPFHFAAAGALSLPPETPDKNGVGRGPEDGPSLPLNSSSPLGTGRLRAHQNLRGWDPPYFQETITTPPTTSPDARLWKTQPYEDRPTHGDHRPTETTDPRGPPPSGPIRVPPSSSEFLRAHPTHPGPSKPTRTHPNPSEPTRTHPNPSEPTRTHPDPTEPNRTCPSPSEPD